MNLSIRTETTGETVIVHVGGDLDVYTAPRLKETLEGALVDGRRLVLDLSEVHFIDSTALGILVSAHERSQASAGDLRLVMDDPYLLKIFHITGFDNMFSIYPEVARAVSGD